MNKYQKTLAKILDSGKIQQNKKGNIRYLLNEQLTLRADDLLDIFEGHAIARNKLRSELQLFMSGERLTEKYREIGVNWWDYCGPILVNSYPTYFEKLPPLIAKINRERRNSKNYVLFLGSTDAESNQSPCLSLIQFQIDDEKLVVSAYQRSCDANLGLPADIYHLYLISRQIDFPLKSITLNIGNVHIYDNNVDATKQLLNGEQVKFELNV
jgi:thymidylate synthase